MQTKTFKPSPKYLGKLRLVITLVALLILAGGILLGWLMSFDESIGARGFRVAATVVVVS